MGGGGYVSREESRNYSLKTLANTGFLKTNLREFRGKRQEFQEFPMNSRKFPPNSRI
jgi:hypothetical protein